MSFYIPIFLIVLALLAVFLRADFILALVYLLLGVYITGRIWGNRALKNVVGIRTHPSHVFFGEKIPIQLVIRNLGFLPVVWLQFLESLPMELATGSRNIREVISLPPHGSLEFLYILEGRKRGIYNIGPLFLTSGDLFGIGNPQNTKINSENVIVYPKIIPLSKVGIPSRSPMGILRFNQPIFEDPTRIRGKRDYTSGDSLRRVDWKASAASGRLQVKLYEPSIALETAIFLNLNAKEYDRYSRIDASELGIIVAASLASWVVGKRQSVGLYTNGIEVLPESEYGLVPGSSPLERNPLGLPPRKGRGHLMRILETLARVQVSETYPLVQLLRQEIPHLAWGTTLILISTNLDEEMFDGLFQANRAGIKTMLIPCGPLAGAEEIRKRARFFNFPFHHIYTEKDMDIWRK